MPYVCCAKLLGIAEYIEELRLMHLYVHEGSKISLWCM